MGEATRNTNRNLLNRSVLSTSSSLDSRAAMDNSSRVMDSSRVMGDGDIESVVFFFSVYICSVWCMCQAYYFLYCLLLQKCNFEGLWSFLRRDCGSNTLSAFSADPFCAKRVVAISFCTSLLVSRPFSAILRDPSIYEIVDAKLRLQ